DLVDKYTDMALQTIQQTFGVAWDRSKPAILFFQVSEGENAFDGRLVSFRNTGYDATFAAMKTLLEIAAESVASVEPANVSNTQEIFQLVDNALESHLFKERF